MNHLFKVMLRSLQQSKVHQKNYQQTKTAKETTHAFLMAQMAKIRLNSSTNTIHSSTTLSTAQPSVSPTVCSSAKTRISLHASRRSVVMQKPIDSSFILEDLIFTSCKSSYGGAVYIFSNQESIIIQIHRCKFEQNEANRKKQGDEYYGGSALYLQVCNSNVTSCTFHKNIGSGVKITDDVSFPPQTSSSSLLGLKKSKEISSSPFSIRISNCFFNADKSLSSSSLFLRKQKTRLC